MTRSLSALCAVLLAASVASQGMPGPCWEPNLGTGLALGDDAVSPALQLGFPFQLPGGGTTNDIEVSSNGFIYLVTGSNGGNGCCSGNIATFLSGVPRIAASWQDLNPNAGGGVYFNALPGKAVITWDQVPEYSSQGQNSVQVQMYADGSFSIAIREWTMPGTHDILVGVTPGGGVADPGEVDFTGPSPVLSLNDPTVYEFYDNPNDSRDVAGRTLYFLPSGSNGWVVFDQPQCSAAGFSTYGTGCPLRGPVAYEWFDVNGSSDFPDLAANTGVVFTRNADGTYTTGLCRSNCFESNYQGQSLPLTDDSVSAPLPLGFTQDFAGIPSVSQIVVASNGWIHLDTTATNSRCCNGNVQQLLDEDPGLAPYWTDLNPASGGTVWFNALPGKAVITWDQVPEYGGGSPQTFQAQLFANGDIVYAYQSISIATHDVLVGLSVGGGADDPGEIDFSVGQPFTTGTSGTPTTLDVVPGALPQIGSTLQVEVGSIPSTTLQGILSFGFTNPNIDLTLAGAPGCWLYTSTLATLPFNANMPTAQVSLPIPNNPMFVGIDLFLQGVMLVPSINSLNIASTNGGNARIGT